MGDLPALDALGEQSVPGPVRADIAQLARLADGVAHSMNDLLAAIVGHASVLAAEVEPGTPTSQDVEAILDAGRRGLRVMKDLLAFSHDASIDSQRIDLAQALGVVRGLLLRSVTDGVEIEVSVAPNTSDIEASPFLFRQALLNLGVNAAEAIRGVGKVRLSCVNVTVTSQDREGLAPGEYVRILVSDTGSGMPPEVLSRAFEPFFTTKGSPSSAGLGLTLVARVVAMHHGAVAAFSKPGLGTTVTLHFPALKTAARPRATRSPQAATPPGGRTVLVVDDEPAVRRATQRMLQTLGFAVTTASNGAIAVERYRESADKIDAVLLDLVMPNKDGMEVLQEIKEINPQALVFVCSGFPISELGDRLRAAGADGVIRKPFSLEELEVVLAVLDEPRARTPG